MKRLASPSSEIKPRYTAVVVGSGYGGAIAASRLARAGADVCLLERGREWLPGEFPSTSSKAFPQIQAVTPRGHFGPETGLYQFLLDEDVNVFHGCGLGGTSLVNANVSLRADPRVFEDSRWPEAITGDLETRLSDGYRRAETMLRPAPYPEGWPALAKMQAHERSAAHLGENLRRVPVNVTFADGPSPAGVDQKACTLCGDCVTGCNYAAKNTTAMNYLPDAVRQGAEIYCGITVESIEKRGGAWAVRCRTAEGERAIEADVVILAAGSLGSTEILLRSRERGLPVSDRLGLGFTGNGDVLGFGYNNDQPVHGIGAGGTPLSKLSPIGPCITSAIDLRDEVGLTDGLLIEEGSVPGVLGRLMPLALAASAWRWGRDSDRGLGDWMKEAARLGESLLFGPYRGAMSHTQTYLVMAHDSAEGQMTLRNDRLRVAWPGLAREAIFEKANEALRRATAANGGTYVPNPTWSNVLDKELITVHPLGGCCLGHDASTGVVNHKGQVFAESQGTAVHEGLYVMDGAVIPMPLGVNPLLTISALAERAVALAAEDRGWTIRGAE